MNNSWFIILSQWFYINIVAVNYSHPSFHPFEMNKITVYNRNDIKKVSLYFASIQYSPSDVEADMFVILYHALTSL